MTFSPPTMTFSYLSRPAAFWLAAVAACAVVTLVVLAVVPDAAPFTPAAGARAAAALLGR